MKQLLAKLLTTLAAATGLVYFWNRRLDQRQRVASSERVEMPSSATSLSAQPHKRTRLVPPVARPRDNAPPPDSAEAGRTPFYFVPGEALLTIESAEPLAESFLHESVAPTFTADYAPFGSGVVAYPVSSDRWLTVVRLRWPDDESYEGSLARFNALEAKVNEQIRWGEASVTTWMPNWLGALATSAPTDFVPGSPGAYPRPMATPPQRLALTDAPFLAAWRYAAHAPVTLAVLDGFPSEAALQDATLPASMGGVRSTVRGDERSLSVETGRYYASFRDGGPFGMGDHGLATTWLAAEVIGDEALTNVGIEAVRVATEHGVCSAADIIAGLAPLVPRAQQGEALVVLLAFTIGMRDIIPPRLRLYEEHYEALRLTCLALNEAGATLIGAAGNDASGLQHPPRTRRPAVFRSVIEVTSGQLAQGDLALYANQAKALALFGGEADLQNQIADYLPALYGPGAEGWRWWAGTSLSAAMAAGLAVLLRSGDPSLRMWDVRTQLRKVATQSRNPGNVPYVDLVQ